MQLRAFVGISSLLVFISLASTSFAAEPADILIGYTEPTTGADSAEGVTATKSLLLSVKQINAAGGVSGHKIRIVKADTGSTPKGATEAFDKLMEQKVLAVIGPIKSNQVLALHPQIKKAALPVLVGGTNVRVTENVDHWVFRIRPDDSIATSAIVKYLKTEAKIKKAALLTDRSSFGTGAALLVTKNAHDQNLELVKRVEIDPGQKDFGKEIAELKAANAEALIVFISSNTDVGNFTVAWRKANGPGVLIGSPSISSGVALAIAKDSADGALACADVFLGAAPESRKFVDDYRNEYHEDPDPITGYIYDAMKILAEGLKASTTSRETIREALLKVHGYKGVLGTYDFDANGNGAHSVSIVRLAGGKSSLVKVIAVE